MMMTRVQSTSRIISVTVDIAHLASDMPYAQCCPGVGRHNQENRMDGERCPMRVADVLGRLGEQGFERGLIIRCSVAVDR